jgi:hypothetical protein
LPEAGNPILSRESDVVGIQVTMGAMKPFFEARENFQPLGLGLAALAILALTSGCGSDTPEPALSQASAAASPTEDVEPSAEPSKSGSVAEDIYRQAIILSEKAADESGLTELWFDADNQLVLVSVQNSDRTQFATQDLLDESVYAIDELEMMPAMLLAELDELVASGLSKESIVLDELTKVQVTNEIDGVIYVTTYEIGQDGLIYKAVIQADDEPLGEVTYAYRVTTEGQAALVALKETS